MTEFVASNGMQFQVSESMRFQHRVSSCFKWEDQWGSESPFMEGLREFFLHERDTELGRWRFNKYLTVQTIKNHQPHNRARAVGVLDERNGRTYTRHEGQSAWREVDPDYSTAAAAYFAAHPEPKPWHDVKPGEVWVLTTNHGELAYIVSHEGDFESATYRVETSSLAITTGHRIWPEEAE